MLRERIHPMIGKLSELLVSVNRSTPFSDSISMTTGPRTPLDFKIFPKISPRNNANRFHGHNIDGVGLGIVAALDNSSSRTSVRRFGEHPGNRPGSDPVPIMVNSRRWSDDDNDYTYVTCHHGADGSCTRVYRDGFECSARKNLDEPPESSPEFEGLDFLNACFLCRKKLHGLDIYIYRGERAFCRDECRSVYITNEERKEV
ncbi:PREDICTED: uncharacterized protein LOC104810989 [Tarenaya hassleriana]|uniref:uncharacterized protein LOC104810989 n=1 Tax=Tarenaya hassleriana TaxID=28532 RepID=UPI00053C93F1|nr:PREDICTED: uncharacterized protein LOC104810989 [Tarenaya hassleriana]